MSRPCVLLPRVRLHAFEFGSNRILRAATWLDLWAGHLLKELEKQNVDLHQRHVGLPGGSTDHDLITITFERREMEELNLGNAQVVRRASPAREITGAANGAYHIAFESSRDLLA
jgi:hypothetical protein